MMMREEGEGDEEWSRRERKMRNEGRAKGMRDEGREMRWEGGKGSDGY